MSPVRCQITQSWHLLNPEFTSTSPQEISEETHMAWQSCVHVASLHTPVTFRLLYDLKWETNCRVAGWNGSWPWLSLIYSARWVPLIISACLTDTPLFPREPAITLLISGHTLANLTQHTLKDTPHVDLIQNQMWNGSQMKYSTAWVAFLPGSKKKKKSFLPASCVFIVTPLKPEMSY